MLDVSLTLILHRNIDLSQRRLA